MNKGRLKITVSIVSAVLLTFLVVYFGVNKTKSSEEECTKKDNITLCDTLAKRDTNISMNNGSYSINRNMLTNEKAMGDKDKWTFFIYMCGSDYESKNGAASDDIKEIYEITTNYDNLTSRINEALSLLEGQNA